MSKPLESFSKDWNALGRDNPYGAILTGASGELPQWNLEEFLATGRVDAARFVASLDRIAPASGRVRLLDFGCGVGRVSRALADHFQSVVGIDAAESMITHARRLHASCGNCQFVVNPRPDLRVFDTGSFDVVYSRLVLQHIPPALVRALIPELVRVTARGGVLMFQLPGEIPDAKTAYLNAPVLGNGLKRKLPLSVVRAYRRVKFPFVAKLPFVAGEKRRMAMFGMPRDVVLDLVRDAGASVLAIEPDQSHGPEPAGYEYWLTR
jgi:SAM-dependent methyltransferase